MTEEAGLPANQLHIVVVLLQSKLAFLHLRKDALALNLEFTVSPA